MAMEDFNQPRVQAHAAAAVVNFAETCEQARSWNIYVLE